MTKICCNCGHKLSSHKDEGKGWRCHGLGLLTLQCDCWLRKDRAEGNLAYYDLDERAKHIVEEMEQDAHV